MMKVVERPALLVIDEVAAGGSGHRERVRSEVSLDGVAELWRRDRRIDLRLQRLHLQVGLLKLERGLLQLLIGALKLLGGGLDLRILGFKLLDLYFERANYFAVALALLAHLAHLGSDFLERGRGVCVAVGCPRQPPD